MVQAYPLRKGCADSLRDGGIGLAECSTVGVAHAGDFACSSMQEASADRPRFSRCWQLRGLMPDMVARMPS